MFWGELHDKFGNFEAARCGGTRRTLRTSSLSLVLARPGLELPWWFRKPCMLITWRCCDAARNADNTIRA